MGNKLKNKLKVIGAAALVSAGVSLSEPNEYREIAKAKCNTELSIPNSNDICIINKNNHVKIIDRNGNELTLGAVIDGSYIEGTANSKDFYVVDIPQELWNKLDMNYVAYNPDPEHISIDEVNIRSTPKYDGTFSNVIDYIDIGDNMFGSRENSAEKAPPYVLCWYINPEGELIKAYIHKDFIESYEYSGNSITELPLEKKSIPTDKSER